MGHRAGTADSCQASDAREGEERGIDDERGVKCGGWRSAVAGADGEDHSEDGWAERATVLAQGGVGGSGHARHLPGDSVYRGGGDGGQYHGQGDSEDGESPGEVGDIGVGLQAGKQSYCDGRGDQATREKDHRLQPSHHNADKRTGERAHSGDQQQPGTDLEWGEMLDEAEEQAEQERRTDYGEQRDQGGESSGGEGRGPEQRWQDPVK